MKPLLRVILIVAVAASLRGQTRTDTIAQADLVAGLKNAERWVTFSGDYTGQRHSPLNQLTPTNVAGLKEQWAFDSNLPVGNRGTESTPLFFGGRLYVTGLAGHAWALDARTGKPSWTYRREYPSGMVKLLRRDQPRIRRARRHAVHGTVDARLIALNVKDGTVIWEAPVAGRVERLLRHDGTARREGQGDRRRQLAQNFRRAASSMPITPGLEIANGGSTRCRDLERLAATPGRRQTRWPKAAVAYGSPAATIPI
jgi:glucose dehydrogenase